MIATFSTAAAAVLLVSGVAKLREPHPASRMIVRLTAGAPRRHTSALVRTIGASECAVSLAFLVTGSRAAAALLAGGYLIFGLTAARLLAVSRASGSTRASCGCFGATDSPIGPGHLVVNLIALGAGLAAAAAPHGPGAGLLAGGGAHATIAVGQAALLATLGYLAITSLPALLAARRLLVTTATPSPEA